MPSEKFANEIATSLSAAINASQTSITVTSATGFPAANFRIRIDNELMLVTAVAGLTWTVTRAVESTTAVSHAILADATHVLTAGGLAQAISEATGGGFSKIAEVVATGASAVMEIASIPATYRHLQIELVGRSDAAGAGGAVARLTVETSPTAGAYDYGQVAGLGTTLVGTENIGASDWIHGGQIPTDGAAANLHGGSTIRIFDYANTAIFKTVWVFGASTIDLATGQVQLKNNVGVIELLTAIDRVRLTLSGGNWKATSRMTLYGLSA